MRLIQNLKSLKREGNVWILYITWLILISLLTKSVYGQTDTSLTGTQFRAVWTWYQDLLIADSIIQTQDKLLLHYKAQAIDFRKLAGNYNKQIELQELQKGYMVQRYDFCREEVAILERRLNTTKNAIIYGGVGVGVLLLVSILM